MHADDFHNLVAAYPGWTHERTHHPVRNKGVFLLMMGNFQAAPQSTGKRRQEHNDEQQKPFHEHGDR
jgi:hypothetical protein